MGLDTEAALAEYSHTQIQIWFGYVPIPHTQTCTIAYMYSGVVTTPE